MNAFITVNSLTKVYPPHPPALKNISLSIDKGTIFGIMGQSGAGKSTLLRCLSTLEKPTAGSLVINNQDITSFNKSDLRQFRRSIGMIFQHFHLLSGRTVADNIAFPMEIAGLAQEERIKRVEELLHLVRLIHKKDAYPSTLSGGEKQRVGIARALAMRPEILFCDEATSALDPKTTKEILHLLKELNQKLGLTIVLITHQMEVIKQICHQVAVLDKGELIEQGAVSDVFSEPKHTMTKTFLQNSIHELPLDLLKKGGGDALLLRLYFKGSAAKQPIITNLIRTFDVTVNILLGWLDAVQDTTIGVLTIELIGSEANRKHALTYLSTNHVRYEVIER